MRGSRGGASLFERGFESTLRGYDRSLKYCLRHRSLMLIVFFATLVGTVWMVVVAKKGFFPQEDIGQLSVSTEARQDISFEAMVDLQQQVAAAYRRSPHVANVASIVGSTGGSSGINNGRLFVELKPRDQRPALQKVLADLRRDTARIPGITTTANPVQNLRIGGRSSRAEYQFVMQSLDRAQLFEWSQKMADAMSRDSRFVDVNSDLQINATQAMLDRRQGQGELARHFGGATALDALFGLRQPANLDHLRHRRQLLRRDGVHRQDQLDNGGVYPMSAFAIRPASWCRSAPSPASSAPQARSPSISWGNCPSVTISFNLPRVARSAMRLRGSTS